MLQSYKRGVMLAIQDYYERDDLGLNPVIMRPEEVRQVSAMLNEMIPKEKLAFIATVQNAIGDDAGFLFEQLGNDAPIMSYLGGLAMAVGIDSTALNEIARGMEYEDQVSIKQLSNNQNNDVNFSFIMSDAMSGMTDEERQELEPSIRQAVEALLTYQVNNNRLDLTSENAEFTQDQLRAGVSDELFKKGLEFLPSLFPKAEENITDTLNGDYHVLAIGKDDNGDIVYTLYELGEGIVDPTTIKEIKMR